MKKLMTISLLALFFLSLRSSPTKEKIWKKPYNAAQAVDERDPYTYLKKINDVNMLIAGLNDSLYLEDKHVGFTSEYSTSYAYFERLTDIASDSVLLLLTHNNNPKLRIYGMWALTENNRKLALNQLQRIRKDHSTVMYFSGCITMPLPVCYLVASRFDSSEVKIIVNGKKGYAHFDVEIK